MGPELHGGRRTERANAPTALPLRWNLSWAVAGNLVHAACQGAMLVVLAKLGSPEQVGIFALGLAIAGPVFMLLHLQLRTVLVTRPQEPTPLGTYVGLRHCTTVVSLLVVATVVWVWGYRGEAAAVVLSIGLVKALDSQSDLLHGFLQRHERMDRVAQALAIKGLASVGALGTAVGLGWGLSPGVGGMALAGLAVWLLVDKPAAYRLPGLSSVRAAYPPSGLAALARQAFPMGLFAGLFALHTAIPRYFVEGHGGSHDLGIFAALAYLVVPGTTVATALGQATVPRLARLYGAGQRGSWRLLLGQLTILGLLLGMAGVGFAAVLGHPLLSLLFTEAYAAHADLLVLIMGVGGLTYVAALLGAGVSSTGRYGALVPLGLLFVLVNLVTCAWWVPSHGLWGAAWAWATATAVYLVGAALLCARAFKA